MTPAIQLQFQRLPAEAQRAALWRLALSGLSAEQMAERTGWSTEQIRAAMQQVDVAPRLQATTVTSWPGAARATARTRSIRRNA